MSELELELIQAIEDPEYDWDGQFDAWVRRIFDHQYANNAPYQRLCKGRGVEQVSSWRDVPAVPTDAFKFVELSTAPNKITHTFLTSGTTLKDRGRHLFTTLDIYKAAILGPFRRYCLPSGRMPMLVLTPSPGEVPESSLSFMLGELLKTCANPLQSGFFISKGPDGELDFDFDDLVDILDRVKEPVFILGTAFAFVEFLDTVEGLSWKLPAGSRVLETGGLKGRSREVSREELYQLFEDRLGIAPSHCLSEYSMTELSSQAYSDTLARGSHYSEAVFRTPPWVRVEVVDPLTLDVLDAPDARGLIRWIDLANLNSVMAIQTSDMGQRKDGGFVLEGRAEGAELRGCSLAVEEIIDKSAG